jgi:SAM-dependent methyltransferase
MSTTVSQDHDYLSRHLREMAPHRAILRSIEARLMASVPLVHPVLDIGCGDGHFASVAYREPIDVGLDVMDRDLNEAATRRPVVFLDLVKASATNMPFPDGAFATVLSNCVIEHIPDVDSVMSEIARVLKPGGIFATTLPSEHYPEYLLGATIGRKLGLNRAARAYGNFFNRISHHHHVDAPEIWKARLESVGLEIEEHTYYFSRSAHHAFDLAHYLGAQNLASKRLLGKWVLHPIQAKPFEWWYRRYYDEPLPESGAYQFVRSRKRV